MKRIYHIIVSGIAGIGLADGLASIYRMNPPLELPKVRTAQEAAAADAAAIRGDFERVWGDVGKAYAKEIEAAR